MPMKTLTTLVVLGAIACISAQDEQATTKSKIDVLVRELRDPSNAARLKAARVLEGIGPPAKAAIPELRKNLTDADHLFRMTSAVALARIVPESNEGVASLVEELKSKNVGVRCWASHFLTSLGKAAIPSLAKAAENSNADLASESVWVLLFIGEAQDNWESVTAPVLSATKHKDAKVRGAAAVAIGACGGQVREFRATLESLRNDPDDDVRNAAAMALRDNRE